MLPVAPLSDAVPLSADVADRLAARLREAAAKLRAGDPLTSPLSAELQDFHRSFETARNELAERLGIPPQRIGTLDELRQHTLAVRDVEAARRVASIILALAHTSEADYEPLARCRQVARGLLEQLEQPTQPAARRLSAEIAGGRHPLAALAALVGHGPQLRDDEWEQALDVVRSEFGKDLATAALRFKLICREIAPRRNLSAASQSSSPTAASRTADSALLD